jgi:hypothetical protein
LTVATAPLLTTSTRSVLLPLIVSPGAAAPSIVTFLPIVSALRLVIVWPSSAGAKVIVPPVQTVLSAWRNDPGPLSAVLVTVTSAGQVNRSWSSSTGLGTPPGTSKRMPWTRVRSNALPGAPVKAVNGRLISRQPLKSSRNDVLNRFSRGGAW